MMNQPDHPLATVQPTGCGRREHRGLLEKESSCEVTLENVLHPENIAEAWKRVRSNKGAAGTDGMSIGDFPSFAKEHWETIRNKLAAGSYSPSPVRRVQIPKGGGKYRLLGIPTVLDRVIQQAISQVLTPHYDPTFSEHSHGFRPLRNAHDAIDEMQKEAEAKGRRCHVVDCDLEAFFDTVDHQKLMGKLRERITNQELLKLILRYLKAGVILPNGKLKESQKGVPQGGPLSPLLANILLDELDAELEKREHKFVRYADDFVILCGSLRAGERILKNIRRYLTGSLKLTVNSAKSKVAKLPEASFLGFQIIRRRVQWTEKSQKKFKAEIRRITHRTRGHSPVKVLADLRAYTRGAMNYYAKGMKFGEARDLNKWLRSRMRLYYWKQWGRPRTRRWKLLKLGIRREEVHKASRSRKGPWRMSHNSLVHRALTNEWLTEQGLPSIENQWNLIRYPEGPKKRE